jgi:hypothetical protein
VPLAPRQQGGAAVCSVRDACTWSHTGRRCVGLTVRPWLQNFLYGFIADTLLAPYILPGAC